MNVKFLFTIAKFFLPIVLRWIADGQREGHMVEGEKRLLARQLVAASEELGLWNDIGEEIRTKPGSDIRDILTGRVRTKTKE